MVNGRASGAIRACVVLGFAAGVMFTLLHASEQDRLLARAAATSASQNTRGRGQKLVPAAIKPSKLTVRVEWIGRTHWSSNLASPVAAGSTLIFIDQWGSLDAWDGTNSQLILNTANLPAGITLVGREAVQNVAANTSGSRLYVMFTSSTVPGGIPQRLSPRPGANAWHVLYGFDFDGTALSNPTAITALQTRDDGVHTAGGLTMVGESTLLFATSDNGLWDEDGREYPQDPTNHLGKIVRIDVSTGTTAVVAMGMRNTQRLIIDGNDNDPYLVWADVGGRIAEEINTIRVSEVLAGGVQRNYGWGRNAADGKAREGIFYIDPNGIAVGAAPVPEPGFAQPIAQFGRENAEVFAATGPVASPQSFTRIRYLLGDLVYGSVYALTGTPTATQSVYRVALVDSASHAVTLRELAGGGRADPRFFNFPDGTAGVLLEATGDFYRLTEVR